MILEGEDAIRFCEYLNRPATEEEIKLGKEVALYMKYMNKKGKHTKFNPPV